MPFWVRSGFQQPTDAEAAHAVPTEWILPSALEQPERVADPAVSSATVAALKLGHGPWPLRGVGRATAAPLRPVAADDYAQRATAELQRAEAELSLQDPHAAQPPAWGLLDSCWTVATTSTQGCPSRWYFLGLPLS